MHVNLAPAQPITTPVGVRMTFITTGGLIDGPKLHGEILPGGGDWLIVGGDGSGRVDVRATIRTHDDVLIHYEARGIIKVPADGLKRLAAGEVLAFDETLCADHAEVRDLRRALRMVVGGGCHRLQHPVAQPHRLPHLPGAVNSP